MAITSFTATPLGGGAWRLAWVSSVVGATFYLYRDGVLVLTTRLTSTVVAVGGSESPVYEVLDDAAERPAAAHPPYAVLAWYASPAAAEYRVEELLAGEWTERTVVPDDGSGYFTWRSGVLADGQTHQFRVTPIGDNGNTGTAKSWSLLMVRVPDVPLVTYTYNGAGAGTVTIAAAS